MLPFAEVTHLPSSTSYYSAILEPLGLRFLLAQPGQDPLPSIIYGNPFSRTAVLEVRQVSPSSERRLKRSHLVIAAPSVAAVKAAHAASLLANPEPSSVSTIRNKPGGEFHVTLFDLDNNTMDVIFHAPPDNASQYNGSVVRGTQSTKEEAGRILQWHYDVASSVSSSAPSAELHEPNQAMTQYIPSSHHEGSLARRPASHVPEGEQYVVRRITTTTTTTTTSPASVSEPPVATAQQSSSGLSTGTVVGALLGAAAGAAAGAALTLSVMRADRNRAPQQEFAAPVFAHRGTFPDSQTNLNYNHNGRVVEVERKVEKVLYPQARPALTRHGLSSPEYMARYRSTDSMPGQGIDDMAMDSARSRHSGRSQHTTGRTRSEAGSARKPLLLAETEHRSQTGSSRASTVKHPPIVRRSYTSDAPVDVESYVSARSHRSSSTVRPSATSGSTHTVVRSKASSRAVTARTTHTANDTPSEVPRSLARTATHVSARHVPLPGSVVGSSHAAWDDDVASIAPSDSISCVGSRRSGRSCQ